MVNCELIIQYRDYLKNGLEKIKPILFECFLEYYGKCYEGIITENFNNTEFLFYVNEQSKFKSHIEKKGNFKELKRDYKTIQKIIRMSNNQLDASSNIFTRTIFSTTPISSYSDSFLKSYFDKTEKGFICETGIINEQSNKCVHQIYLPLFFSDDAALIHELIHAVNEQILFTYKDKTISKTGLITSDIYCNRYLEEGITEIESRNIYMLFKSKNTEFLDKIYPYRNYKSAYDLLVPIILQFYEKYKSDIIYSRLTLDRNRIVYLCNKDFFDEYSNTIDECYKEYPNKHDMYSYKFVSYEQIKKMNEYTLSLKK